MCTRREREIRSIAKKAGVVLASIEKTKRNNHYRIVLASGKKYFTSSTTSDNRANKNLLSALRKLSK